MSEFFQKNFSNFIDYQDEFIKSIGETFTMLFFSGIFVLIFGLIIGTILVVTKKGNLLENQIVYHIIDKVINVFRSVPFVILLTALIPITQIVMGTFIGVKGAIFPLVIGATPFFVRQVETALSNVDKGVVEAAQSMGLSPLQIILRVYLRESVPQLARAITITTISLLGLTAMGGAVGGGGIGAFVIRYGHNRKFHDITWVSVITIIIFVTIIQVLGEYIARKTKH